MGPGEALGSHEEVILVDAEDRSIGIGEKMHVHRTGLLHRAVSAFVFDPQGRVLLQRRAAGKYHCGGLWSNAACTHPRVGEGNRAAAERRLREEMGLTVPLRRIFGVRYRLELPAGMYEHEFDHVCVGVCEERPCPDAREVDAWRWAAAKELARDVKARPGVFTAWFALLLPLVLEHVGEDGRPGIRPGPAMEER